MKPRRQRLVDIFPYRQSGDGCPLCVICELALVRKDGLPRHKGARYCSDRCCDEAWVRAGITARIRELLLERDKGICADCGVDCAKIKDALDELAGWSPGIFRPLFDEGQIGGILDLSRKEVPPPPIAADPQAVEKEVRAKITVAWRELAGGLKSAFLLRAARLGLQPYRPTWEAHHLVSVVEGGGGCGLEGYATLCLVCHKRASAKLAARRAIQGLEAEPMGQMPLPFA